MRSSIRTSRLRCAVGWPASSRCACHSARSTACCSASRIYGSRSAFSADGRSPRYRRRTPCCASASTPSSKPFAGRWRWDSRSGRASGCWIRSTARTNRRSSTSFSRTARARAWRTCSRCCHSCCPRRLCRSLTEVSTPTPPGFGAPPSSTSKRYCRRTFVITSGRSSETHAHENSKGGRAKRSWTSSYVPTNRS